MTVLLLLLKASLALTAIVTVRCFCRWQHIDGVILPGAAVLILCGAVRVML